MSSIFTISSKEPTASVNLTPKIIKDRISAEYKILRSIIFDYSSLDITKKTSLFFDELIKESFSKIENSNDFCLVAGGSYSNLELCPYSDIDLMIITDDGLDQNEVAQKLKDFFYTFWDAAVDLAQSVRTVEEAINISATDFNTYTSFINARFIDGNVALFDLFKKRFNEIDSKNIFFVDLMKSLRRRRLINVMTDNDILLLEPDVKEGMGGIRDYSYCDWSYRIVKNQNQKSFEQCLTKKNDFGNSLNPQDITDLLEAKKFIFKVRIMMHLISGKKVDKLTFDLQERLADAFFYKNGKFLNKIEYFMHDYYKNAKNMHINSRLIINYLIKPTVLISQNRRANYQKNYQKIENIIGNNTISSVNDAIFYLENGLIEIRSKKNFLSDSDNIFKLLETYQTTGERLGIESINMIKIAGEFYKKEIKNNEYAKSSFLNILKRKKRVYKTLLLMHETNILTLLIPEFEKIDSLSTNDVYHVYTVDAHSLNGINYLQEMVNLKINIELKSIFEDIDENDLLILNYSLLLHDIGKGYSSHHEVIGSKIAVKVAKRLGIDEQSRNCIGFLILNHFLLPLASERRDIHDPATIRAIAETVKDIRYLRLLFIVSICDSMAVSKNRFNSWRKMLLSELYERTALFIKNEGEYFKTDEYYFKAAMDYISKFTDKLTYKEGYGFLKKFNNDENLLKKYLYDFIYGFYSPRKYLVRESKEDILIHLKLFSKISPAHRFNFLAKPHKEEDYYELVICGEDRKSIFSEITGVLSYFDFNILSADINSRKDGQFIDTFFVNHVYKKIDGSNFDWHKLRNTFYNVFNGSASLSEMFKKKTASEILYKKSAPKVSNSVEIYNNISDEFTVIEIQALDRKGLLYDIGRIFNTLGISIFVSKITTQGNKAYDTFYVKGESGGKIKSLLTIKKIKRAAVEGL